MGKSKTTTSAEVYYPINSEGKMAFWEWIRAEIPYTIDAVKLKLTREQWDSLVEYVINRLDESIPDWFDDWLNEWEEDNEEDEEDGEDE